MSRPWTGAGAGVINSGTNRWYLSGPPGAFTTNSVRFNCPGYTRKSINFVAPKRLVRLTAFNGGSAPSTVSATCDGQQKLQITVSTNQQATLVTNPDRAHADPGELAP